MWRMKVKKVDKEVRTIQTRWALGTTEVKWTLAEIQQTPQEEKHRLVALLSQALGAPSPTALGTLPSSPTKPPGLLLGPQPSAAGTAVLSAPWPMVLLNQERP